jgi:hypothetical protein
MSFDLLDYRFDAHKLCWDYFEYVSGCKVCQIQG